MANNFDSLGVSAPIIEAIKEMGFETPTNVQQEVIPCILEHRDVIVMSKTGSGKTGAFGIPVLQSIVRSELGPGALILAPTRELAVQVDQDLKKMSKHLDVRMTAVYGQHDINAEIKMLKSGVDIVTGTPGRVFDHIKRKTLKTKNIQFVVLDEADCMLDMGFIDQMVQIIKELPKKRVTLLFSATMPDAIKRICRAYMHEPLTIELQSETKTVDTVKQTYCRVKANEKRALLAHLLKAEQPDRCMIFCNTRDEVDRVQTYLSKKGYQVEALHGANSQSHRMKTIEKFKKGVLQIVVATDVAARGIHIEDLSLVINYDVPKDKNSYVHRIGRTARAGNSGKAITLATSDDIMSLYEIEEHVGVLIDEMEIVEIPDQEIKPKKQQTAEVTKKEAVNKEVAKKKDAVVKEEKTVQKEKTVQEEKTVQKEKTVKEEKPVKKSEEVTIMIKNLGPVKVTYLEEPKEESIFAKSLQHVKHFIKLFKKSK